ncbi:hypothetical protein LTR62_006447 [Meristemomyces frigidus]|uniref:Uncharacterized protein n=1 Tax=Meristemomyces frigidus TaxID=1508187 RepID=A0AAN7YPU4_9PEZI|nr:hypothetical protein LTR62_006447 [Meristemomyces frigidus]
MSGTLQEPTGDQARVANIPGGRHDAHTDAWSLISELYPHPNIPVNTFTTNGSGLQGSITPKSTAGASQGRNDKLNHANTPPVPSCIRDIGEVNRELQTKRHQLLLLSTRQADARQAYEACRRFTEESILEIVLRFTLQRQDELSRTPGSAFDDLREQLKDDGTKIEQQSRLLRDLDAKAGSLILEIKQLEDQFVALSALIMQTPRIATESRKIQDLAVAYDDLESQSTSSDLVPRVARQYFELQARLSLKRERLADVVRAHHDTRLQRDFDRDQDLEPETSDQIFYTTYDDTLQELREAIAQDEGHAEEFRNVCEAQNIDLGSLRRRRLSLSTPANAPTALVAEEPVPRFSLNEDMATDLLGPEIGPTWHVDRLPAEGEAEADPYLARDSNVQAWLEHVAVPQPVSHIEDVPRKPSIAESRVDSLVAAKELWQSWKHSEQPRSLNAGTASPEGTHVTSFARLQVRTKAPRSMRSAVDLRSASPLSQQRTAISINRAREAVASADQDI